MSRFRLSILRKHSQRLPPGGRRGPVHGGGSPPGVPWWPSVEPLRRARSSPCPLNWFVSTLKWFWLVPSGFAHPRCPVGHFPAACPAGFHAASRCEAVCSTPHKLPAGAAGPGDVSKANSPTPLPDVAVPCPGWLPGCRPTSPPMKNQPWASSIRCPPAPPEGPPRLPCSWSPGCEEAE